MLLYLRFARIEASCSPMPRRRRPNRTHAESVAASVFVRRMGSMFLNYGNNASHYDDCFSLVVVSPVYQIPICEGLILMYLKCLGCRFAIRPRSRNTSLSHYTHYNLPMVLFYISCNLRSPRFFTSSDTWGWVETIDGMYM